MTMSANKDSPIYQKIFSVFPMNNRVIRRDLVANPDMPPCRSLKCVA